MARFWRRRWRCSTIAGRRPRTGCATASTITRRINGCCLATISRRLPGPGPLIGPVLAAQWGFAPGFIWLVIGACLAGAVHDFVILLASVRQRGLSLPQIARQTIGPVSGVTTSMATLFIIICTLASVGIVVVKALAESSWGMFTILVTIPAALLTGLWMYKIRPGRCGRGVGDRREPA